MATVWAFMVCSDDGGSTSVVRWWRRSQKALPAAWLVSDGSKNRNKKSSRLGTRFLATRRTSGCVPSCSPPRGAVPTRMSLRTRSGKRRVKRLGNVSAHGKTEHIDALQPECTYERRDVVGLCLESVRRLAARAGDSSIVEQNHGAVGAETVGDQWVPVVHSRAKMWQAHQRSTNFGAVTA